MGKQTIRRRQKEEEEEEEEEREAVRTLEREMGSNSVDPVAVPMNLKRFLDSSHFSDFTIRVADRQFQVHKLVLCAQSEYFSGLLLNDNWIESNNNGIELFGDDPRAVEAMIRYMYDPSTDLGADSHGEKSPTVLLTRIYAAAEKYRIPKLKEAAKSRFKSSVQNSWDLDDFPQVVEEVYTTTHTGVRGLRDEVVQAARVHVETLTKKDDFQRVLESQAGFAADMVRILVKGPPHTSPVKVRCVKCENLRRLDFTSCSALR